MPYANRVIHLDFPELSEEGDEIWLKIRNPKLVPPGEMRRRTVKNLPDGTVDEDDELMATYEVMAKLVIGGHVYDGMSTDDEVEPLSQPLNAVGVAKLPTEILTRIGREMAKANPQAASENQEATTSS